MNKRSAIVMAAGLVFALMSGTVARVATLRSGAPVKVVVQTISAPLPAPATTFNEGGDSG